MARGLAAGTSAWMRWQGQRPAATPATRPTIVIGGLAVGGAGRTPLVEWLARALDAEGWRVAVVAHGYRGQGTGLVRTPDAARGDEAAALRRALPARIPVVAGPSRVAGLAAVPAAEIVLLDGGFQDRDVPATARIALVDATAPRGVLPAGPLREPLDALARADAVWLHRVDEPGARPLPAPWVPAVESRVAVRAVHLPGGEVVGPAWLRGRAVRPLTGIARPASFRATLAGAGAEVLDGYERADHHRFSARELAACAARGGTWVTTTKDRERLPPGWPAAVVEVALAPVAGDVERVLRLCRP
ncbi:MAG: tetraacyldisaccharide 4'-kinase [Myxococcales bacterium]|nr:tetraacyldisaccharide 4'-kinase [Myxococcales bacterium]